MFCNLTEIEQVAIHEAGHAMLANFLGFDVYEISIAPLGDRLGYCLRSTDLSNKRWIKRSIIVDVSGFASYMHFTGDDTMKGFDGDYASAVSLAEKMSPYPANYVLQCIHEATRMINLHNGLRNGIFYLACDLIDQKIIEHPSLWRYYR